MILQARRLYRCHVVVLLMKYPKTSILLVFSAIFTFYLALLCRVHVLGAHSSPTIQRLLQHTSTVIELSNGSANDAQVHIQRSTFSFVMFYAHWCASSRKAIQEFHRASEAFKGQVTFIAINCWVGSCRQTNHFNSFPHLYFYHSSYDIIEYRGQTNAQYLIKFIQNAIHPLTYISNPTILQSFLDQGKPSLLAYCNGTNHLDRKYNELFGAALQQTNQVSSLQFGVITSLQVASAIGMSKFGQVALVNPGQVSQLMYPSTLNFTSTDLLQWLEQSKVEYVKELDPELSEVNDFRMKMKTGPFVVLFVAKASNIVNRNMLKLYHQVALDYHNCSCTSTNVTQSQTVSSQAENAVKELESGKTRSKRDCDELLRKPHVTSCQSLPLSFGFRYGVQNVCDVCQECYRMCSCDVTLVAMGMSTSSVLRNMFPLHSGCRSLRKNYLENNYHNYANFFSVCCFPRTMPEFREAFFSPYLNSIDEQLQTDLVGNRDLDILAGELENLKGSINDAVSRKNPGMVKSLFQKLLKMFSSDVAAGKNGNTRGSRGKIAEEEVESRVESRGTCEQRGTVSVFTGAGCYSNKTVAFHYMDSRKYWSYAKALGVRGGVDRRTALVIVDVENEAQYVLPEEAELTNDTIVNFIMNFTLGNLARRLRSAPVPSAQPCGACVVEVVTLTFDKIVLDPNKDVLLMYYTMWCGFCKSVSPAYVALAHHYRLSKDVVIARLNADLNDLPWEYTVDSYPTFVFFPAKRKDMSVVFPKDQEFSLENFILFVARQRNTRFSPGPTCSSELKLSKLRTERYFLQRANIILQWRLRRQLEARRKADRKRLDAERRITALLNDNFNEKRSRLALEGKVGELRIMNENLLDELLSTREKLKILKHRAIKIANELRVKVAELDNENVNFSIEAPDEKI